MAPGRRFKHLSKLSSSLDRICSHLFRLPLWNEGGVCWGHWVNMWPWMKFVRHQGTKEIQIGKWRRWWETWKGLVVRDGSAWKLLAFWFCKHFHDSSCSFCTLFVFFWDVVPEQNMIAIWLLAKWLFLFCWRSDSVTSAVVQASTSIELFWCSSSGNKKQPPMQMVLQRPVYWVYCCHLLSRYGQLWPVMASYPLVN